MTITKLSNIVYKIEADEGYTLVAKDKTAVYGDFAYAPSESTTFIELPDDVAEELRKEIEENENHALQSTLFA
jgi:hypothetical protein